MNIHDYSCSNPMHEITLGVDNCGKSCIGLCMSEQLSPLVHRYSCLLYSSILTVQFYYHEYSRYKTGIIHEYSRIYTMNHTIFMVKKAWVFDLHQARSLSHPYVVVCSGLKSLSTIFQSYHDCLVATGSSMLIFIVLPH